MITVIVAAALGSGALVITAPPYWSRPEILAGQPHSPCFPGRITS